MTLLGSLQIGLMFGGVLFRGTRDDRQLSSGVWMM